jgi:magnesium chelatase family protein
LFLDELTEFKRTTLEVLRQPLENKTVCIARAQYAITFPSSFLLVAALNPCPCGYWGDKRKTCLCSAPQISKYLEKLSGPLLDRIDLQVHVQSIEYETIKNSSTNNTSSKELLIGIARALEKQAERFEGTMWNAYMTPQLIEQHCKVTDEAEALLKKVFERLQLSMRGYHKILKVARTIADLDGVDIIDVAHIQEAAMYRSLDQTLDRQKQ